MRRFLFVFATTVLLAMLAVTVRASFDRSVLDAARDLWLDPWGRATLFDAYFGFLTVWLWIAWREGTAARALVWLIALLGLGNIAIAVYLLRVASRLPPAGGAADALLGDRARGAATEASS